MYFPSLEMYYKAGLNIQVPCYWCLSKLIPVDEFLACICGGVILHGPQVKADIIKCHAGTAFSENRTLKQAYMM